jgi:hypothetical protein
VIDPATLPLRITRMKAMSASPQHYFAACQGDVEDPTLAMRLGTLGHAMLWPDVAPPYAIYEGSRRGKAWDEFRAAHGGIEIFTRSEANEASGMAEALDRHDDARELLRNGTPEVPIMWNYCGRAFSSRLDVRGPNRVVELKTAKTSHPDFFVRDGSRMSYHAQVAAYRLALAQLTGRATCAIDAHIVAVEKKRPYVVTVFDVTERALREGEKLIRAWYEQIVACEEAKSWPGYSASRCQFDVPDPDEDRLIFDEEDEEEAA